MPGTNLTRDEAHARAALLDVESYAVDLVLDPADATTFRSDDRDPVHVPRVRGVDVRRPAWARPSTS